MTGIIKRITQLPQYIADRIAAGEVVDRPISIVKELVENSIDAGSTSIVVEIRNGGKTYIRVTDNGSGIAAEDAELAFSRHATSKITSASDLDSIATLGFRGEALASIAAVSRTELVTKTADEKAGTYLLIEGGQVAEHSDKGAPTGTTLIVRDLFYNTPARLKFLKSDNAESSQIIDFVSKIALAYPDIRVRLINNGTTLFATPGKGDRFVSIATIYDPNMAKKLIKVEGDDGRGMRLEGYISTPENTRPNRKNQIFFVNGRYISSKILENSVSEAYRARMFEGRFPTAFLFLWLDPALTDVNIHPNKKEIRFDDEKMVSDFVTAALKQALAVPEAVPEITLRQDTKGGANAIAPGRTTAAGSAKAEKTAPVTRQEELDIRKLLRDRRAEQEKEQQAQAKTTVVYQPETPARPAETPKPAGTKLQKTADVSKVKEDPAPFGEEPKATPAKAVSPVKEPAAPPNPERPAKEPAAPPVSERPVSEPAAKRSFAPSVEAPAAKAFAVENLQPKGIIFNEYILCADRDAFYIIDQHAAHERIFYEQFVDSFYSQENAGQVLLTPITLSTSFAAGNLADEWMDFLRATGFAIEEFGVKDYIVREIPAYMDLKEAEEFLEDFTEDVEKAGSFRDQRRIDKIITKACKSAVKANDRLSDAEVAQLLKDLGKCRNPFSCPHGRPTVIRMTHAEIDRLFKR